MPIFISLICLVAMGLALFRRSVPLSRPARRCARTWFSLDQGDNDSALFWAYLVAALNTAAPRGDTGAPWLLQPPSRRARRALSPLLNDLGAISDDVVLVLDDYHVIDACDVQDGMGFLLDHLPPQIHLVIASGADPPLPLIGCAAVASWPTSAPPICVSRPGEATAYLNDGTGIDRSRHTHVGGG